MGDLANAMNTGLDAVEKSLETPKKNRRCEDCDKWVSWREGIDYCPNHGKPVTEHGKPRCFCGHHPNRGDKFCVKCGAEFTQGAEA